ncbi:MULTISPECIES: HAD hydrolase-like protein [unclassified Streptococcus]|uniref:HAD hydrolase-like protein n=1 Tax=Streptococcus sp. X16XC17 TaxID=2316646 RepID=UPI001F0EE9AC|nr:MULTISPECIES: HAD hydrolase-like protein [unclassified Streptococcus]
MTRYWIDIHQETRPTFVWDLDGTLIDSYPAILRSLELTYQTFGWEYDARVVYEYIMNASVGRLLGEMAERYQLDFQEIKQFYSADLKTRDQELGLFEDSLALLEWTKEKGIANFIYTHKGDNTERVLKMLWIDAYFTESLHSQSGFARKPDAEAMDYLVEKYNLNLQDTYYIGDRKLDMDFAINSHVQSISLSQPDGPHNFFIQSLSALPKLAIFSHL